MNSGERAPPPCVYGSVCVCVCAPCEIKNRVHDRCRHLFCIIRKRGRKKESFPTVFETLFGFFFFFSPSLSRLGLIFRGLRFFPSFERFINRSVFFFFYNSWSVPHSGRRWLKTPLSLSPPLFTWVTMEIKGLFRRRSRLWREAYRDRLFSGPKSRRESW